MRNVLRDIPVICKRKEKSQTMQDTITKVGWPECIRDGAKKVRRKVLLSSCLFQKSDATGSTGSPLALIHVGVLDD